MAQSTKLTHKDVKEMVKHDAFREKTMEGIEYVSGHRSQIVKYVVAGIVVIVLAAVFYFYREGQRVQRQNALNEAMKVYNSQIVAEGNPPPFASSWFRNKADQDAAKQKVFNELVSKYGSSDEGMVGHYYLAVMAAENNNTAEAEKQFKIVADDGSSDYASLAKLSLAQLYKSDGKFEDGRKLMQSLVDKPTAFVSKEQATIELARYIGATKPDEARKLLEPLRTSAHGAISQAALTALGELSQKK